MEKTRDKQPDLPFELIEAILKEVSDQKDDDFRMATLRACALLSRDFAPVCRKMIFRSITLHPAGYDPLETDSLRRATMTIERFGEVVASNPHLADQVQDLTLWVLRATQVATEDAIKALKMVCGLTHLTLGVVRWDQGRDPEDDDGPHHPIESFWRHHNRTPLAKAVLSLIQGLHIASLAFKDISIFSNALLRCPNLRSLEFFFAGVYAMIPPDFSGEEKELIDTERRTLSPPVLETLRIDGTSAYRFAFQSPTFINLGSLRALTVPVIPPDGPVGLGIVHSNFIPMARNIADLCMIELLPVSYNDTHHGSPTHSMFPLRHLSPLAYATLTHLEYSMRNGGHLGGDWTWRSDPYHYLLQDPAFFQLRNLKALSLKIILNSPDISDGPITSRSFGSQWGTLDTTICPPSPHPPPFPSLGKVSLHFDIEGFLQYALGRQIARGVQEYILDTQFPRLKAKEAMGRIELNLAVTMLNTFSVDEDSDEELPR